MSKDFAEFVEQKKEELEEDVKECKENLEKTVQELEAHSAEDIVHRETAVHSEDRIEAELEAVGKALHLEDK